MTTRYKSLPAPRDEFVRENEQTTRRQIEQNFEDLDSDVTNLHARTDKVSSLSLRRFQFMMMGASNG